MKLQIVTSAEGKKSLLLDPELPIKIVGLETRIQELEEALRLAKKELEEQRELQRALTDAGHGWEEFYPGKSSPAYFFLTNDGKRVVVQELLREGVGRFEGTFAEWIFQRDRAGRYSEPTSVRPDYPIISLSEVAQHPCPICCTNQPRFERYYQTHDSPEYDQWDRWHVVICCGAIHVIDHKVYPDRRF